MFSSKGIDTRIFKTIMTYCTGGNMKLTLTHLIYYMKSTEIIIKYTKK